MTARSCAVHAILLPGCPHRHPADTYRESMLRAAEAQQVEIPPVPSSPEETPHDR